MRENPHSTPVLCSDQLSIGYPQREIASAINLHINPGELTAVIGINGSGKSTLLKNLTGELPQKSGRILLNNTPLANYSANALSEHISIVLSNPSFSQHLSVFEVVALGRHPYTNWLGLLTRKDKKMVNDSLAQIGIADLAERKCNQLSDGQLQKVFIARALAQDTELIILDEPTNHLDLYHKAFALKLLKELTKTTQKSILFATHELNLALQLCDQIILVNHGKISQDSPKNLIENGHLEALFPKDLITFDRNSGSFRLTGQTHHKYSKNNN